MVNVIIIPGQTDTRFGSPRFYFQSGLGLVANFIFSPGRGTYEGRGTQSF